MDETDTQNDFVFLPSATGDGVLIKRAQVVGSRPNGPNGGAVVYTAAGPSIYTSLQTSQIAKLFDAQVVEGAR